MESPEPLDGQDFSPAEKGGRFVDAAGDRRSLPDIAQGHRGSADGAGDRLGVVAAVERVVVFASAVRAEGKPGHRRPGPVVWQPENDGVARPAIGAVRERIGEAPVGGIADVLPAGRTDGYVRGDEDEAPAPAGRADFEVLVSPGRNGPAGEALDAGQLRPFGLHGLGESPAEAPRPAFDVDLDAAGVVLHPARQSEPAGQPDDERPEADSLDDAEDVDPEGGGGGAGRGRQGACSPRAGAAGPAGRRKLYRQPQ